MRESSGMDGFEHERPDELLRRLKIGREEAMQRLLTSLIIGGPYPRWNSRSAPSQRGVAFLRAMYLHCIGEPWPGDDFVFVDEYELRGRTDGEKGGAPDWAVLWDGRVWLIELKSERGSHRADQIPTYFTLARHHHPTCDIDITYLTPSMHAPFSTTHPWERYAHLSWDEVVQMVRSAWSAPVTDSQAAVVDGIVRAIERLELPPSAWRALELGDAAAEDEPAAVVAATPTEEQATTQTQDQRPSDGDVIERALELAKATAEDGKQRALDVRFDSLDSLLEARVQLRERMAAESVGAPVRFVMPWIWREQSTGSALTDSGRQTGYELRFSKYSTPQV